MSTSNYRQKTRAVLRALNGDCCCWCGGLMGFPVSGEKFKDLPNMATVEHHHAKKAGLYNWVPLLRLAHKRCNI